MDPLVRRGVLRRAEQAVPALDLIWCENPFDGGSFGGKRPLIEGQVRRRGRTDEQAGATPEVVGGIEQSAQIAYLNGGEFEGVDEFGPKEGADALGLKFELMETSHGRFAVSFAQVVENGFRPAIEDRVDLHLGPVANAEPFGVDTPDHGFELVEVTSLDPELALGFRGVDQREKGPRNAVVLSR